MSDTTSTDTTLTDTDSVDTTTTETPPALSQPIPPPTQPQQYRAIGLLWGKYTPSAEEINKGILLVADGTIVDAVVKGKVLGLVKSSIIDLEKEHLWVVYPKTPKEDSPIPLHVQIAGIWEPETLHPELEATDLLYKADEFSIQGEVVFQENQQGLVVVKIQRAALQPGDVPKYFKLKLLGYLPPKAAKNFWEFKVKRVGTDLVIQSAENIASLAPPSKPRGGHRPFKKNKGGYRPKDSASAKPFPKKGATQPPVLKKPQS
ncbi:MAG: hypothetical protein IGS39_11425 [Calothrix sp. C42_A2020_038]|nr:hypothetical protein [Calothrix sp. C42_A2020_038]